MKRTTTLTFLVLSIYFLNAQNVIWSEDFSNGIPSTWLNYDSTSNAVWNWSNNINLIGFGCEPPFAGTGASNGFVFFDSDDFGNNTHDVRLQTDVIDCSSLANVIVKFENQYSYYSDGVSFTSITELGVSTDGSIFTYFPILQNEPQDSLRDALTVEQIDISSIAAGQATVYLQFRWRGYFEYAWELDEITVQDGFTIVKNDISINGYSLFPNFETPLSQTKPIEFALYIKNNGIYDATNVKAKVEVRKPFAANALVFTDSIVLSTIQNDTTLTFLNSFHPQDTGLYRYSYSIKQDSSDEFTFNNSISEEARISDNLFSKDNGKSTTFIRPAVGGNYQIGNIYETGDAIYKATTATFSLVGAPFNGKQIDVLLYKVDSAVGDDFQNFDTNSDNDLTLVAAANHVLTLEQNYDLITVNLLDINTGLPRVILEKNTRYFLVISFTGSSNQLNTVISECLHFDFQLSTVVKQINKWYLGGFGAHRTALLRMSIDTVTTPTERILVVDDFIKIYPNPVNDILNIDLSTQIAGKSMDILIINTEGRIVYRKEKIVQLQEQVNVKQLPAGWYTIRLIGDNTSSNQSFLITN